MLNVSRKCSILAKSAQFWSKMLNFGQKCSILVKNAQVWAKMLNFGQKCSENQIPPFFQKSSAAFFSKKKIRGFFFRGFFFEKKPREIRIVFFVENAQSWLKMLKFGQKCSILAKNAQVWPQMLRKPNATFFSKT